MSNAQRIAEQIAAVEAELPKLHAANAEAGKQHAKALAEDVGVAAAAKQQRAARDALQTAQERLQALQEALPLAKQADARPLAEKAIAEALSAAEAEQTMLNEAAKLTQKIEAFRARAQKVMEAARAAEGRAYQLAGEAGMDEPDIPLADSGNCFPALPDAVGQQRLAGSVAAARRWQEARRGA